MPVAGDNEWESNRKLIMNMLGRLEDSADATSKDVSKLTTDMELLKQQSKMWGAVMGAIGGGLVTFVVQLILRHVP